MTMSEQGAPSATEAIEGELRLAIHGRPFQVATLSDLDERRLYVRVVCPSEECRETLRAAHEESKRGPMQPNNGFDPVVIQDSTAIGRRIRLRFLEEPRIASIEDDGDTAVLRIEYGEEKGTMSDETYTVDISRSGLFMFGLAKRGEEVPRGRTYTFTGVELEVHGIDPADVSGEIHDPKLMERLVEIVKSRTEASPDTELVNRIRMAADRLNAAIVEATAERIQVDVDTVGVTEMGDEVDRRMVTVRIRRVETL